VHRMKAEDGFKYRLHIYDCSDDDEIISKHSVWFQDLDQALDSVKYHWWSMSPLKIAPGLIEELHRVIRVCRQ